MSKPWEIGPHRAATHATAPVQQRRELDHRLVSLFAPSTFAAEQYRVLRHTIVERHNDTGLRTVAVASAAVGDGKTTTAINLAGSLAQAPDARVLLVDADLRRASVSERLGVPASVGLVDAILDPEIPLDRVVQYCPPFNLSVLPTGPRAAGSYEVLQSRRLDELLQQAREQYDYIVLDTPPLAPLPDCRLIARSADGFIVVVAAHRTPRRLVEEALSVIDPAKMIGLVFNGDDRPYFGYYGYSGYYPASPPRNNGHGAPWWRHVPRPLWRGRSHRFE